MEEYFVEEKTGVDRLLDFLVFVAVFVVTIFLILEIVAASGKTDLDVIEIAQIYFWVNIVVFLVFLADLIRLWIESSDAKYFFKHYWLDVLATIPFGLFASVIGPAATGFNVLKLASASKLAAVTKLQKVSRISKISKEFKAAAHLKEESDNYQKKNRL